MFAPDATLTLVVKKKKNLLDVLVDELLLQRGVQREINGGKRNVAQETRA